MPLLRRSDRDFEARLAAFVGTGESDPATREPLAPYGGSSPAMNAVVAACKSGGLLPFANFNRIHVCPPCNVTDAEAAEGLAILDAALEVADQHVR